mmetsp:Transcript_26810/g.104114  ORF Transcript_26810/g.104114 Transcript_26810/m.104114 type:complete len:82 (-) Transcript_26810:72-317(-)
MLEKPSGSKSAKAGADGSSVFTLSRKGTDADPFMVMVAADLGTLAQTRDPWKEDLVTVTPETNAIFFSTQSEQQLPPNNPL